MSYSMWVLRVRDIARQLVEKPVLLKNDGDILPIKPRSKIFTGPAMNDTGVQCGGWTMEWQGYTDSNKEICGRATTIWKAYMPLPTTASPS